MSHDVRQGSSVSRSDGAALVTFERPPIDRLDAAPLGAPDRREVELRANGATQVVALASAGPELAHGARALRRAGPPAEPRPPVGGQT